MIKEMLTQKRLKQVLNYNKNTGIFTCNAGRIRVKEGKVAGTLANTGYICIRIDKRLYSAHRLAFLYMTGSFPIEQVDHISHDRTDNRWANLRQVSRKENQRNLKMRVDNKSGFTGVHWYKPYNKWVAKVKVSGKAEHLGYFKDINKAIEVRKKANLKYGFHLNHGSL